MQMSWNTSKEAKFDSIYEQRVKITKISGREPAFLMLCIHVGRLIGVDSLKKLQVHTQQGLSSHPTTALVRVQQLERTWYLRPNLRVFLLEKHPKSELNFHQRIQIRKKLPQKFHYIQTVFLCGFSSCQIYLKRNVRQPQLLRFCCLFLPVAKLWKKLGTSMNL